MSRPPKDPLRALTDEERELLTQISRSFSEPASHVAHAKALLAVAKGKSYTAAAQDVGRRSGDAVAHLVARFNDDGLAAVAPRHGGGAQPTYGVAERERILREARRTPDRERDGTATWSLTTYEISCPALRDSALAPEGKTGLIVSSLFDYSLMKHIETMGRSDEFRKLMAERVIRVLDASVYPGLVAAVSDYFTATPLTIERISGNSEGAITGWAFTNDVMPAVRSLPGVARSVLTPIPDTYQAGQWTYSPSGLPISILTGKLAADRVLSDLA